MKTYKVDSERDSEVSEFLANKFQQKNGFDYNCHEQYKFKNETTSLALCSVHQSCVQTAQA